MFGLITKYNRIRYEKFSQIKMIVGILIRNQIINNMGLGKWILKMMFSLDLDFLGFIMDFIAIFLVALLGSGVVVNIVAGAITVILAYILWRWVGVICAVIDILLFFVGVSTIFPAFTIAGVIYGILSLSGKRL